MIEPGYLKLSSVGRYLDIKDKRTLRKLLAHPSAPEIICLPSGAHLVRREDLDQFILSFAKGNRAQQLADEILGGGDE